LGELIFLGKLSKNFPKTFQKLKLSKNFPKTFQKLKLSKNFPKTFQKLSKNFGLFG
jgi:hypothetical protein